MRTELTHRGEWNWPLDTCPKLDRFLEVITRQGNCTRGVLKQMRAAVIKLHEINSWDHVFYLPIGKSLWKGYLKLAASSIVRAKRGLEMNALFMIIEDLQRRGRVELFDAAVFSLAACGLCRADEIFPSTTTNRGLTWRDVKVERVCGQKGKVGRSLSLTFPTRKNDPLGRGHNVLLPQPYLYHDQATRCILKYLSLRRTERPDEKPTQPLFARVWSDERGFGIDGSGLAGCRKRLKMYVRNYLKWSPRDAQNVTLHGLRATGVTFLLDQGVDLSKVKHLGGWASDAVLDYDARRKTSKCTIGVL